MTPSNCVAMFIVLTIITSGCTDSRDKNFYNPYTIYITAQKKIRNGAYKDAISELETFNNHWPNSPCAINIQLQIICAAYKAGDPVLTKTYINRFLRSNPNHPNSDYALYMLGLSDMALENNMLQKFFKIDRSNYNPKYMYAAFLDFSHLIQMYPNSCYVKDAVKHLAYIKNRLAQYELSVVKYYNARGAYVAVIKRVEQMLLDYRDTQATRQALFYMKEAYRKLQLNQQANKVDKIIAKNLP